MKVINYFPPLCEYPYQTEQLHRLHCCQYIHNFQQHSLKNHVNPLDEENSHVVLDCGNYRSLFKNATHTSKFYQKLNPTITVCLPVSACERVLISFPSNNGTCTRIIKKHDHLKLNIRFHGLHTSMLVGT